jgi:hypothetical protein
MMDMDDKVRGTDMDNDLVLIICGDIHVNGRTSYRFNFANFNL